MSYAKSNNDMSVELSTGSYAQSTSGMDVELKPSTFTDEGITLLSPANGDTDVDINTTFS